MNWEKAIEYGEDFVSELKEASCGDFSNSCREAILKQHLHMLEKGGWKGFTTFNRLSVKQMQEVLWLENPNPKELSNVDKINQKIRNERATLRNKPVPLIFCKEDETDNLDYDDYMDLINFAELIEDNDWRKDLLERVMAK